MGVIFLILGAGCVVWGLTIFGRAVGGIHEVYAAVMVTGGLVVSSLGVLIKQLQGISNTGDHFWAKQQAHLDSEAKLTDEDKNTAKANAANPFSRRHG
jgi:hypothetical protein